MGKFDRLPDLADELVRLEVDVIAATTSPAAVAARNATRTIPIVMFVVGDPVALGLIASLARPGGNITGLTYSVGLQAFVKQLELLKETVPKVRRVAVLSNPANPGAALAISNVKVAARSMRVELQFLEVRSRRVRSRLRGDGPRARGSDPRVVGPDVRCAAGAARRA